MAEAFQPPPTWADVVLVDEVTKRARFNPVWLKWFVDLIAVLNNSGAGGGQIEHQSLGGLQGGSSTQRYHVLSAEASYLTTLVAGTQAISAASLSATGAVSGASASITGTASAALFSSGSTTLVTTTVGLADGSAGSVGTLTNAPAAGNPTKWVPIDDNGTTRYLPAW